MVNFHKNIQNTYINKVQNLTTKFVNHRFQASRVMVCEWLKNNNVVCEICSMGDIGKMSLLEDLYYTFEKQSKLSRICLITVAKYFNIKIFKMSL